ncbi:MAG: hypothetical protein CL944_03165 [Candidatus Diapherotrites archaeon]|uniref:dolichyl-phosphooligosaccharide-protein glycotransferase n=1 Tax=Candidatus Iainarchaeum sp. TaxID=3101447 RepID=A0A2D6LQI5_9ARCH|nr:hypothetical protein [Candidatus Diapherotrites archaeon]
MSIYLNLISTLLELKSLIWLINLMNYLIIMLEKIKSYLSGHEKELLFGVLIFLLAFAIRAHLMIYDFMFGFDPYFHARLAQYVAETLTLPSVDPLAYFQIEEGAGLPASGAFFWFFTAIIFKIVTLGAAFSKDSWVVAVKVFPAIFGALISVAMYFLGKEMYSKKAGVTMALFAAVIPSFVYRTMAGFFEEDALGFLWMVLGLVFFVKAVKNAEFNSETIKNAVIAAGLFALMAWTWQMFLLVPIILVAWFPSTVILMWFRKENNEKIFNLTKTFAITFILFSVVASALVGTGWIDTTTGYVTSYLPVTENNIERINTPGGDGTSVYSISVGEEQQGFRFWGNKYNALIAFPFAAILLFIPYRLLRKKNDYVSFMIFYWVLVAMFMAFIRLKFTYVFGLPIAAAAGITLHELFSWVGNRASFEKKTIAFVLGFMFLVGIAAGSFFVAQNVPNIEQNNGWKESLLWINENTPEDATFFNWWDEGHWVTFIAERGVSADNRNYIFKSNSDVATFMLTDSKEEAIAIVNEYNPTYILLSEDLIGKMGSLGLYAYNLTDHTDPRVSKYFSVQMNCGRSGDSLSGNVSVQCGGNVLTEQDYLSLPFKRLEEPNQLLGDSQRVFIYRNEIGSKLFIMNKAANDSMIVKLFFNIDNEPEFDEIYSNKEVRIFKLV